VKKMNKAIICGICAAVFLLVATPTIPAQQYMLVKENIQQDFEQHANNLVLALQNMKENNAQGQKDAVLASFNELKGSWSMLGLDNVRTTLGFFLSTLLALIFAALGTLFAMIFGPLITIIIKVITFLPRLLAWILSTIFHGSTNCQAS
jgi:hypothetical protein